MSEKYLIYSVEGNRQRLDGGAMFGNAPKALWSRWVQVDELNRIDLACRAFLIVDQANDRRILLETGIGAFFEPKLRERYGVEEQDHRLLANLRARGVTPEQIDVVVLSHLHFDHAGGLLSAWSEDAPLSLVFPKARVLTSARAWQRAQQPHLRDRVSYIPELSVLLQASGRLELIEDDAAHPLGPDFCFSLSDGHTPGQLLTELTTEHGSVVFGGDLVPGAVWMNGALTLGYDRFPELLIDEKARFLARAREQKSLLLFTHDTQLAAASVALDDRGRYAAGETYRTLEGLTL